VQLAAGRRVHWMVAREYCQHPLFGCILRPLQVIPTNRSGMDTGATKTAVRLAAEGRLVGMFPEGRINRTGALLQPIRSGAAVVASRAGVPIIPLLIEGSPMRQAVWSPVLMPAHVKITFGTPVHIPRQCGSADQAADVPPAAADTCDQAMLTWGRQLAGLAEQTAFEVRLASARASRRQTSKQVTVQDDTHRQG
jgi:1-acyl-sn-glycerol-3-phosphate acyltransferase